MTERVTSRRQLVVVALVVVLCGGLVAAAAVPGGATTTLAQTETDENENESESENGNENENESESDTTVDAGADDASDDPGAGDTPTGADVLVEQPSYVETEVQQDVQDGIPVYIAEGEALHLHPQNFDTANVTNFGIVSGNATLEYDSEFDRYTLTVDREGSHRLYWETEEPYVIRAGDQSRVDVREERYEAVVRVDGFVDVAVFTAEDGDRLRDDAAAWRDWNETVTEIRESGLLAHRFAEPEDNEAVMQGMVNSYLTTRSPFHLLQGGFTAIMIIMFTSLGGLAALALLKVPDLYATKQLWRRMRQRMGVEELEGDISARQEELDLKERLQRYGDMDWQDIPGFTDHDAYLWREGVGETPLEGLTRLLHVFDPETMKADRLRAMGACGYAAEVLERTPREAADDDGEATTDGGEGVVTRARVVDPDDVLAPGESVHDHADLVPLADAGEALMSAIPVDDDELLAFEPEHATFDPADIDQPLPSLSLARLIDEFDFDDHAYDDPRVVGELAVAFVESIRDHPISHDDGQLDSVRLLLERLLHLLQDASDRHQVPLTDQYVQHFRAALDVYDEDKELEAFLERHRTHTEGMDAAY